MTLYGDVCVRNQVIAEWRAHYLSTDKKGRSLYEAELTEGVRSWKGTVYHIREEGAAVLASKILAMRPPTWPVLT